MTDSDHQNDVEHVRDLYEAFSTGDYGAVKAALADDIEFVIPQGSLDGGTYRGPDDVLANAFSSVSELEIDITLDKIAAVDDMYLVLLTQKVETDRGESATIDTAHVLEIEAGQVTRLVVYTDTARWNELIEG